MQVRPLSTCEEQAWDEMVMSHPLGSVFQTSAFKRVIWETFPQTEPHYIALLDSRGAMKGGMPLFLVKSWLTGTRLVSLPFAFYCDPLVHSTDEFSLIFEQILRLYAESNASYLEIKARNSTELLMSCAPLKPVFYHRTYWIDLTVGIEEVWKNLHKTAIQQRVRRSEREGIRVRRAASERDVRAFFEILLGTRRRLGLPPQNYGFFARIWQYLVPAGMADVLVAEIDGSTIGGVLVYTFKDTLGVAYVASRVDYWPLGVDQALFWKTLQMAVEKGFKVYDIGKTSPHAEGLMTYKKRWGGQELETPCFYYPGLRGVSSYNDERRLSHRIMKLAWQKLPRPAARLGGRFVYRHLG